MNPSEPDVTDGPLVLALDPGRCRCGIALVARCGTVLMRSIVSRDCVVERAAQLAGCNILAAVIIGDGTGCKALACELADAGVTCECLFVDERHTSELARKVYVSQNPARGFRRLIPKALRVPDAPYDDYVAVILANRWWQSCMADDCTPS